jgi:hypothetical protein
MVDIHLLRKGVVMSRKIARAAGYCKLCREKEIELYGTLVTGKRHTKACLAAGCGHPFWYGRSPVLPGGHEGRVRR